MRKNNIAFIGRSTIDHTYLLDNIPQENTKCFAQNYLMQYGGPSLNAAITAAFLGADATLISCFGDGIKGQNAKIEIKCLFNISVVDVMLDNHFLIPTSAILVNSKTASRTIINSPKIGNEAAPDYSKVDFTSYRYILLDGYNITPDLPAKLKVAKQTGSIIILDGGSWKPELAEIIKLVDYAVCSQVFRLPGCNKEQTIANLKAAGTRFVAFTNDDKPIEVYTNEGLSLIEIDPVQAVDTLGAGDVLHGAFCFYLTREINDFEALQRASIIATKSCQYFGTHSWCKK